MALAKTKYKIDTQVMIDLILRGMSVPEIASYFNCTPGSVRSKIERAQKSHPEVDLKATYKQRDKASLVTDKYQIYEDRFFSDLRQVQDRMQKIPLANNLDHLEQRMNLILKGMQILEKASKMRQAHEGKNVSSNNQVLAVTNIINNAHTTDSTDQSAQPFGTHKVIDV